MQVRIEVGPVTITATRSERTVYARQDPTVAATWEGAMSHRHDDMVRTFKLTECWGRIGGHYGKNPVEFDLDKPGDQARAWATAQDASVKGHNAHIEDAHDRVQPADPQDWPCWVVRELWNLLDETANLGSSLESSLLP